MRSQLVKIQVAVVTEDVVYRELSHHLLDSVAVNYAVLKFLIITQCAVIDPDALDLDIGLGAVDGDFLRRILTEAKGGVVNVGTCAIAVYV